MRHEFSKPTKREALKRSNGLCEAVGAVYGLEPGQRCNAPLSHGVEFDHYPVPATERDSDGLENCVACCKTCHAHKTRSFDIPVQAKTRGFRTSTSASDHRRGFAAKVFAKLRRSTQRHDQFNAKVIYNDHWPYRPTPPHHAAALHRIAFGSLLP